MIGRIISHYRILSPLGSGGMGVVYEAEDTRLGRHVALKLLPPDAGSDPLTLDRFLREARIVSTLNHPHICTLHDIGAHEGQQFMVMELLEGEPLKERIARGPLPVADVLEFGVQIADALDAAHAAGVVHRDIKPANLFITRRGQAKVLDFGVAKLAESSVPDSPDFDRTIAVSEKTTAGAAVGTVAYMSPEQARGLEIDARSDLFSFGEVLYEMATGKPAFAGATPAVIFEGILTQDPPPPSQMNADVPPELDRVIAKALEKDRDTRYQSAADMRADLRRLKRETETGRVAVARTATSPVIPANAARAAGAAVGSPAAAAVPAARRNRMAVLIGAPAVTLAVIGAALLWQAQRTPALTERDTVVLADFRNRTGDTMFDDTLTEALAVQLRQSPFLNLLSEQQVQTTLRQMGRGPMEPLTPEVARELCQRAGAKAMLGGTIANIGNSYLLTLAAEDCVSGDILVEEQTNAAGKDNVIAALGTGASAFRERLGESLASVQRYDQKIEQATTRSLEALKAYSQGMTARRTQGDAASLPFFRRAVEIDPEFALGHARLGTVLSNTGQLEEAKKAATMAFERRGNVSERERFYIEARYHTTVTADVDKAMEAYRLMLATYPDDYAGHSNLGSLYRTRGMLKEAIASLEEAVRLAPGQPISRNALASAYADDGRVADAIAQLQQSLQILDSSGARGTLYALAVFSGNQALADEQVAAATSEADRTEMLARRVQAAGFRGRMNEAHTLFEELVPRLVSAGRIQSTDNLLSFPIGQVTVGRDDLARAELQRLQKLGAIGENAASGMLAIGVLLDDRTLARAYLDRAVAQVHKTNPPDVAEKSERSLRALAALGEGRYQEAYETASALGSDITQTNALFVVGHAAFALKRWDDSAKAFSAIVGFRHRLGLSTIPAVSSVMLGRAHAAAGRAAEARKSYEEAFAIWKDADPDLPLLVEARAEYQRLTS